MKYKYDKLTNKLRHLSSLKSYPCSGEGWEDGKEYEEGEFEVKVVEVYSSGGSSRYNDYKLSNGEIITCHRDTPPKVAVLKQKEDAPVKPEDFLRKHGINESTIDEWLIAHPVRQAMEEYAAFVAEKEYLACDNPWPLTDVLQRLIHASETLLHKHDYDGQGYEELNVCVARAKEIINLIENDARSVDGELVKIVL